MTQAPDYDQLLYQLERLRAGDVESGDTARRELERARAAFDEVAAQAEPLQAELTETASMLRAGVPDLRAPVDPSRPPPTDLAEELNAAEAALKQAEAGRTAAIRAAQLPPLLPRVPALARNLLVYGVAMVVAVFAQVVLTRLTVTGQAPDSMTTWFIVMPPVVLLIIGYVGTSVAGTPRIAMTDRRGEPIPFTVYKSPRLGATLAVLTVVGFLLWHLGVF